MRNILIGIVAGFLIGVSLALVTVTTASSIKPKIVGGSGVLENIEVHDVNGDKMCEDPFWYEDGTISCA